MIDLLFLYLEKIFFLYILMLALCLLIWLMTTKITKNIYFCNNNVCLGVCRMVFMSIDTFKNNRYYEGGGGYLRVFMRIDTFKNYF